METEFVQTFSTIFSAKIDLNVKMARKRSKEFEDRR